MQNLEQKIIKIKKEYQEISEKLIQPEIISNRKKLQQLTQRQAELSEIIEKIKSLEKVKKSLAETKKMSVEESNEELKKLAEEEIDKLNKEKNTLEKELEIDLIPPDPNDKKNVIMEIRAGTGGEEAALFAADLFRMYSRFAEKKNWQVKIIHSNRTGMGGFKEIIFSIKGKNVYGELKYEAGVHRVQRIPITEKGGRIHTSTATVAVLPEVEKVEINIDPKDLKIDVFRSSGPGGQSVNTTDSAVRITHLPTNIVVTCQDERSQIKNKEKALQILRSKLFLKKQEEEREKRGEARRIQIGTGERSEKIRTYNFPQDRVTDHRIKLTLKNIEEILDGKLDQLIEKLKEEDLRRKAEKS